MINAHSPIPPALQPLLDAFLPIIRRMSSGRYAITIAGSLGKGVGDKHSDIDFRLCCDALPEPAALTAAEADLDNAVAEWGKRGFVVDGCWTRLIGDIDAELAHWLAGDPQPTPMFWTVWGYYLLPDLCHQVIIEDPDGVVAGWQAKLAIYPPQLKQAILDKYTATLRYWRQDYHYRNKVTRGDYMFLANLTNLLVHALVQVLFAINETYYVGDGNNLSFMADFSRQPRGFAARIQAILYPRTADNMLAVQYNELMSLVDETLELTQ
jgi:hypothetical protein